MDQERFDRWTRSLATGRSRRSFLQGAAASIAAGLVAFRGKEGAAAPGNGNGAGNGPKPGRCGQAGQPCKFNRQCCESSGLVCYDGACGCLPGEDLVNGACVPATDPCESMNCDDGNDCTIDTCANGVCVNTPVPESDGRPCTTSDLQPGICGPGGICIPPSCNSTNCVGDGNPCTETFCLDDECVTVNRDAGTICGDGLACDGSGTCVSVNNECLSIICDSVTGCEEVPNTGDPCANGSGVCTEFGICAIPGQCISGNDPLDPFCPQECEGNSICEGCCSGLCVTIDIGGITSDVCQPVP